MVATAILLMWLVLPTMQAAGDRVRVRDGSGNGILASHYPTPTRDISAIDTIDDPSQQVYVLTNVHISTKHQGYYTGYLNGRAVLISPTENHNPIDSYPTDVRREYGGWYTYFDGMIEATDENGELQYVPLRFWFYYTSYEDAE